MREIALSQGKVALVDDADFELVNQFKWSAHHQGNLWYAMRGAGPKKARVRILLHRFLTNAKPGVLVDHKDGDGLNNCRGNLRFATQAENLRNREKTKAGRNRFKGVYWSERDKVFTAKITVNYKSIHLGSFKNEEDAARAYNTAALKHFGEFARLNEVPAA